MAFFLLWLGIMAFAAPIVLPKVREWRAQGDTAGVPYRVMWQKHVFYYRLLITPEEAVNRLLDQAACAGVAYTFDPAQLQITLRSDIPDGTVPAAFQLTFEPGILIVTRLTRTTNAGRIQLAMGEFWQEKLGASLIRCE